MQFFLRYDFTNHYFINLIIIDILILLIIFLSTSVICLLVRSASSICFIVIITFIRVLPVNADTGCCLNLPRCVTRCQLNRCTPSRGLKKRPSTGRTLDKSSCGTRQENWISSTSKQRCAPPIYMPLLC